ncbi:uncharacterized protein LOC114735394 [Neltuma alba]|uniref:uncharacterized protein LOC114735394 n=1 Tax=Neltuma alba TaxID=207710 RepID=UPI0010A40262|nr:uncharacterized protein LOC114735394 [Prosopis alba]
MTDEKNLSNIPASDSNWFFSLFSSNKRRTASDIIPKQGRHLSAITITSEAVVKAEEHAKDPAPKPYEEETEDSEKDVYKKSELAKNAASDMQDIGGDAECLPEQDLTVVEKAKKEIEEERNHLVGTEKKGSEVIVLVEPVEPTTIQTEDIVPIEGTILTETSTQAQVHNDEQAGGEVGEPYGREILKSIAWFN